MKIYFLLVMVSETFSFLNFTFRIFNSKLDANDLQLHKLFFKCIILIVGSMLHRKRK